MTYNNNNNKKKKPMVNKVFKHGSKIFYLPTRFVSNGKPIKPVLLSSMGKRIVQQIGVNQINHHQQQQPMSIYLKKKKFYHKYWDHSFKHQDKIKSNFQNDRLMNINIIGQSYRHRIDVHPTHIWIVIFHLYQFNVGIS